MSWVLALVFVELLWKLSACIVLFCFLKKKPSVQFVSRMITQSLLKKCFYLFGFDILLYSSDWLVTHYVAASVSWILGLRKVYTTIPGCKKIWVYLFIYLFISDKFSLCSPGYPRTCSVDQASLKLREPSVSASPNTGITGMCHYIQPLYVSPEAYLSLKLLWKEKLPNKWQALSLHYSKALQPGLPTKKGEQKGELRLCMGQKQCLRDDFKTKQ